MIRKDDGLKLDYSKDYICNNIIKNQWAPLINKPNVYTICCTCGNEMLPKKYPSCKRCYEYYLNGGLYDKCLIKPNEYGSCFKCYCELERKNLCNIKK